jgi:5-(carboxyamino)imidazole ribonucleotide synthase
VSEAILPGRTVGVLGSGQLGRMFAMAARRMGYRVHVLSPDFDTPTGQVADVEIDAPYEDLDAVRAFARDVDVVTFEFENVPAATAAAAAELVPVRPSGGVLHVTQNREREKRFLQGAGLPVAPFAIVRTEAELRGALDELGTPAVLKTASFGYDGKGQARIEAPEAAAAAWAAIGAQPAVLEAFVDFGRELAVVVARAADGTTADFGVVETRHRNHILDLAIAPAPVPSAVAREARALACAACEALDLVGVLCVEFFVRRNGGLLVNELAPRPHNSGHLTIDASVTSQFEQQLRAVCGLPLGSTRAISAAAMANLLGDLWEAGEPDWARLCGLPEVKLHLYGKAQPRPGRKMGHVTALAPTAGQAAELVLAARRQLRRVGVRS